MKMHMVAALQQALDLEMGSDESVMLLGEDVGVDGGVFRVTDGLQAKYGEERVVDTPLAEAGIVGGAIGLAINGMKPVAEIQFSGFSYQAFHHFKQHMARFRQRSEGGIHLPMVVRAPCAGGIRALEHHSESPESFYIHCQGLKVVCPSGPYDAKGLLTAAIRDPDPVVFLEPKSVYRSFKEEVPEESYTIELEKANVVREGKTLTVVTWGAMVRLCKDVAEDFAKKDIDLEVIDLRTLWPLDTDTIVESVTKTGRCIVVHEAPLTGGFGGEIVARVQERCMLHLEAPVQRVTSFDVPFPAFSLEQYYIPDKNRIINAINKVMEF